MDGDAKTTRDSLDWAVGFLPSKYRARIVVTVAAALVLLSGAPFAWSSLSSLPGPLAVIVAMVLVGLFALVWLKMAAPSPESPPAPVSKEDVERRVLEGRLAAKEADWLLERVEMRTAGEKSHLSIETRQEIEAALVYKKRVDADTLMWSSLALYQELGDEGQMRAQLVRTLLAALDEKGT